MTAENPVRPAGETGIKNWSSAKEALASPSGGMISQELGLPFPRNKFSRSRKDTAPNRSGSAPPSIEAVLNNHVGQRNPNPVGGMVRSTNNELYTNEELLRSDPSYVAYYISNVNLNPRLPPPITSREARHVAQHASHSGEDWRSSSHDDGSTGPLPTHKEGHDNAPSLAQIASGDSERILSGNFVSSLEGRHKSLVDLIQEDFPRTPSPVYSNSIRSSNRGSTEDVADSEAHTRPLHDSSVTTGKLLKLGEHSASTALDTCSRESTRSTGSSVKPLSKNATGEHANPKRVSVVKSTDACVAVVNQGTVEGALRGLCIASQNDGRHLRSNTQPNSHLQDTISQLDIPQSHGVVPAHNIFDQFSHDQWKLHLIDKKPVLQATGTTPHFYSAAGYLTGNPFYCNVQQSGVYAPPYSTGGYAVNASPFTPFVAGYHPAVAIPMTIESPTAVGVNATDGNVPTSVDVQHLYKYYAQLGVVLPPPFSDSLYTPYIHHPPVGACGPSSHHDPANRGYDARKLPPTYSPDQLHLRSGNINIPSSIKVGIPSPSNYASPPNIGIVMQYPTSPLASLQLPGSPLAAPPPIRRPENIHSPICSVKNTGPYPGWQVLKGHEKLADSKTHSIIEELKSNKTRRFELSDVVGRVAEFSMDQHGSRFIQQKLETCTSEEKASVFKEVLPHATVLMNDVFGNYVIQKYFEYGSSVQRKELANQLVGSVLPLSLQMYGCRVIQKALEVIELDQKTQLVSELDGHVMQCVRDQNGNHVIQKCIECVPTDRIVFIMSAFHGQVANLSMHPYGCRVIQRVLEHCNDEVQTQCIVDEILASGCLLAQDQYGNYVIQHVLERGRPRERGQIISKLAGQVLQMSQHKFASNVIEKCLEHGDSAERELLIEEIVGETEGNDVLLMMMKDQFANYVVQKILETCTHNQREILLNRIRVHLPALKRYTYGKHIVARVEQLCGEEDRTASE